MRLCTLGAEMRGSGLRGVARSVAKPASGKAQGDGAPASGCASRGSGPYVRDNQSAAPGGHLGETQGRQSGCAVVVRFLPFLHSFQFFPFARVFHFTPFFYFFDVLQERRETCSSGTPAGLRERQRDISHAAGAE